MNPGTKNLLGKIKKSLLPVLIITLLTAGCSGTLFEGLTTEKGNGEAPTSQNDVFANDITAKGGDTVTIVSSGDSTNTIWFAPEGTTVFAESDDMTKASGDATSILAPAGTVDTERTYKLFIVDVYGNISEASTATLTVDNVKPSNQDTVFATDLDDIPGGDSVTIVSSGDSTNTIWFAPAVPVLTDAADFNEGVTITKASSGTSTSIAAPATAGDYKLYVIDAVGNVSSPSTATLTVNNLAGPTIDSVVADDPGNGDAIYSNGDTITVTFSENTNEPEVASQSDIDKIFTFSTSLGSGYTGNWSDKSTLVITIGSPGGTPPEIGVLTLTFKDNNGLKNFVETSRQSTGTSSVITGNWGTLAGPTISTVVANDPDDGDAIYSDGDTITITFSEPTNIQTNTSKTALDDIFEFNYVLGADYTGVMTDTSTLVITINNSTGHTSPLIPGLTLTFKAGNGVKNAANTSLESTGTSPAITGDWGTLAGPTISSVVADDPDNGDDVYSNGDTITITFSENTNKVDVSSKALIDGKFSFKSSGTPISLGDNYSAAWNAGGDVLTITILGVSGAGSTVIGNLTMDLLSSSGIKNSSATSLVSSAQSNIAFSGDWGTTAAPTISSIVADDPDNGDAIFSNGDTIAVTFDMNTNKVVVATKANIDAVFSFSQPIGNDYTGAWNAGGDVLTITIADKGAAAPTIGGLTLTLQGSNGVKNSAGTTAEASGTSGAITGDWGTLAGPTISSVVADDADNGDAVYSNGDTITVTFSEATNQPSVVDKAAIDNIFSFSATLGSAYSGSWSDASTLVITIDNSTGNTSPAIPGLTLTFEANNGLKNSAGNSLESTGTSPAISGDWGTLAGPTISSVVADDPDNGDALYSNSDTITVTFSENTNKPYDPGLTKTEINNIFTFNQALGDDYTGAWNAAGNILTITIVDKTNSTPPAIGGLTLTLKANNGVKNSAGTSLDGTGTSGVITGDWGTLAGPTISSVVADDADNADAVYGNGDIITVTFSENTNKPAVATKANIDAVFSFNESLGNNYTGAWNLNGDILTITIADSTGSTPPTIGGLTLTFQGSNGLKNAANTSLESTGTSGAITGDWGTLAGPTISTVVADDPDNADAVYGNGDTITVTFSEATNQPAVATKGNLDAIFSFNQNLGTDYTGSWSDASHLVITVVNATGATPPIIGGLTLTFQGSNGLKNAANTSLESTGTSGAITGDWGGLAGPTITSVDADDADNADAVYGNGDTITVTFSETTNQVTVATKANLDAIFTFNQNLGTDYTGSWSDASHLVITVVNATGATPPAIGGLTLTLKSGNGIKNNAGTSLESAIATSGAITGDWGTLAGPTISTVVADDADNADAVYGNGDTITVTFSEGTNEVQAGTKAEIDALFTFSSSLGTNYTGSWSSASTLVITVADSTGNGSPAIGGLTLTLKTGSGIKNAANTSLESAVATSGAITGDWGTLAGPTMSTVVADDPDNGDAVYSNGDTITVTFSEATNQVTAATKANLDAIFTFSSTLGANYTGSWSDASTLVITIVDSTGNGSPAIPGLTLTLKSGNGIKNAAGTSLESAIATSGAITGDWGTLSGPVISSLVADDPDNGDLVYSNSDTITVTFNMATNKVAVATKADLDAIFTFSQALGDGYTGAWNAGGDVLTITITDVNLAGPPTIGGLTLTFKASNGIKNSAGTSSESSGTSAAITGNWGEDLISPELVSVTLNDAPNSGAATGDTIVFVYNEELDPASISTALIGSNVNSSFAAGSGSITGTYSDILSELGSFSAPGSVTATAATLTLSSDGKTATITLGGTVTSGIFPSGVFTPYATYTDNSTNKNSINTSVTQTATGSWDSSGPQISSVAITSSNGTYHLNDILNVDITFNETISLDNGATLTISLANGGSITATGPLNDVTTISTTYTITEGTTSTAPTPNNVSLSGGDLQDAAGNSLDTATYSTADIRGAKTITIDSSPQIASLVADDPDNGDAAYGNGDTITMVFDQDTNQPTASTKANLDNIFTFSASLGTDYTGSWTDARTLVITIVDSSSNGSPAIGSFNMTVKAAANLKDDTSASPASTSTSGNITGDWGTVALAVSSAETMDSDGNGKIDHYKIIFNASVDDSTFPNHGGFNAAGTTQSQWEVAGYSGVVIVTGTAAPESDTEDDNVIYLKFTESAVYDSGAKPDLTTTSTPGLTDTGATEISQIFTTDVVEVDKAKPVVVNAAGVSGSTSLTVTFSEAVYGNNSASACGSGGELAYTDITYNNNSGNDASSFTAMGSDTCASDTGFNAIFTTNSSLTSNDNGVDSVHANGTTDLYDGAANTGDSTKNKLLNITAGPIITSIELFDSNNNGKIEQLKITFSKNMDDSTISDADAAQFTINGTNPSVVDSVTGGSGTIASPNDDPGIVNDNVITVFTDDTTVVGTGALTISFTTASGKWEGSGGIALATNSDLSAVLIDKAPPVMLSAIAYDNTTGVAGIDSDDTIVLTFSEATNKLVFNTATVSSGVDIDTILQLSGSHTWGSDNALTSATWNGNGDQLTVKFSAAGTVPTTLNTGDSITITGTAFKDNAAVPNVSTNIAGVQTISGSFYTDTYQPYMLSITNISDASITITYSEPMLVDGSANAINNILNYKVIEDPDGTATTLTVTSAVVVGSNSVQLNMSANLSLVNTFHRVEIESGRYVDDQASPTPNHIGSPDFLTFNTNEQIKVMYAQPVTQNSVRIYLSKIPKAGNDVTGSAGCTSATECNKRYQITPSLGNITQAVVGAGSLANTVTITHDTAQSGISYAIVVANGQDNDGFDNSSWGSIRNQADTQNIQDSPKDRTSFTGLGTTVDDLEDGVFFSDPFVDGTSFSYSFNYGNRVYLGTNDNNTVAFRFDPAGTNSVTTTFAFDSGSCTSTNGFGYIVSDISSVVCGTNSGPNAEVGVVGFNSVKLNISSTDYELLIVGPLKPKVNYIYYTQDLDTELDFKGALVSVPAGQNSKSIQTIYGTGQYVFSGISSNHNNKKPMLNRHTVTESSGVLTVGAGTDIESIMTNSIIGEAKVTNSETLGIDSIVLFKDNLYVANSGGVVYSSNWDTGTVTSIAFSDATPTGFSDYTLEMPDYNSTDAGGLGKINPGSKGIPILMEYNNKLYMARNVAISSTDGEDNVSLRGEVWECTPGNNGDADVCDPGDWSLIVTGKETENAGSCSNSSYTNYSDCTDNGATWDFNSRAISMFVVNNDSLYLGYDDTTSGAKVYRLDLGTYSITATSLGDGTMAGANWETVINLLDADYPNILSSTSISDGTNHYMYITIGYFGDSSKAVKVFKQID